MHALPQEPACTESCEACHTLHATARPLCLSFYTGLHANSTGEPAGGPSELLVDDGSEGAGPSAAPPVTAEDIYSSYAALILGTGTSCLPQYLKSAVH